jgi:uncharacterized protein (TIGR03083 family)
MSFLRSDEAVVAYIDLRSRVIDLLRELAPSDGARTVPLCPAWTVADLVAHMVGVNEDILEGRMDGVTTEAWTKSQVDRHRGETLAVLADGWQLLAASFDQVLPHIPAPVNSQLVMDAVTHEHDLRNALGRVDARDTAAVNVALGWLLDMVDKKVPGLASDLLASDVSRFDLLRSLSGRRSHDQMERCGLPLDSIVGALIGTPLRPPSDDIESIT